MKTINIIADIGGTNARFACCDERGKIFKAHNLSCLKYKSLAAMLQDYMQICNAQKLGKVVLAVPCPVISDNVFVRKCNWRFKISQLQKTIGAQKLIVVNDLAAQALAAPRLKGRDKIKIGGKTADKNAPLAVLGVGTGLGTSFAFPCAKGYEAVACEGGHIDASPANEKQSQIVELARTLQADKHIAAEDLLSGNGLPLLHKAVLLYNGQKAEELTAEQIAHLAFVGNKTALETMQIFFAMLGCFAGNLALSCGARGGVYISGGILPREEVLSLFLDSDFMKYFTAKGHRFDYLDSVPVYLMIKKNSAFEGLKTLIV